MSDTTNAALIAEARKAKGLCNSSGEEYYAAQFNRLADALEAADARSAVEYQRGHDRAEHRYKSAIANYKLVAETFEAERDAALAVIEQLKATGGDPVDVIWQKWQAIFATAPADVLAEHDRVIAEKAWEEGLDAGRDRWMDSREFGDKPVNPHRANPEPKEGE